MKKLIITLTILASTTIGSFAFQSTEICYAFDGAYVSKEVTVQQNCDLYLEAEVNLGYALVYNNFNGDYAYASLYSSNYDSRRTFQIPAGTTLFMTAHAVWNGSWAYSRVYFGLFH